jgi:hypothetical protein
MRGKRTDECCHACREGARKRSHGAGSCPEPGPGSSTICADLSVPGPGLESFKCMGTYGTCGDTSPSLGDLVGVRVNDVWVGSGEEFR